MKDPITYLGEHLWVGRLGVFFISLAFASALIGVVSYYLSFKNPTKLNYKKFSRSIFIFHVVSVFGTIGTLFYMMHKHYFEFAYVWKHTDLQLEPRYLFAAFWEDQEGSFLLWAFWHAVIGVVLMFTSKKWESSVMMTLSLVQVWLFTMVMGIYVGGHNIGTNPFILMRDHPQFSNIPLFSAVIEQDGKQVVDYISKLAQTARGMNPLLKNYWMTIHPPTLFLGFALTVVPFCFSVAGLMSGRHKEWQKTALPWTFAGVMILGTGILMGGAWAYEALSFGGFWAWDPVENASFVPWLTLVGAAHLMLVNKARGTSFFSTYLFSVITFILVLYSTFLTRSGILGDSSVHAFTDLGMERLLIYFVVVFILLPVTFFLEEKKIRYAYITVSVSIIAIAEYFGGRSFVYGLWLFITMALMFYQYFKSWSEESANEEKVWSREFWMFIGSLVLFILAISISGITSFPVINRVFHTQFIAKDNGMNVYNIMGMLFGIFVLFFMAKSQFLKYKNSDPTKVFRQSRVSAVLSVLLTLLICFYYFNSESWEASSYFQRTSFFIAPLFVLFSAYTFFANFEYMLRVLNGKIKQAGASIAHAGFALIMLGCVLSNSGKRVISENSSGKDISPLGPKFSNSSNILLQEGDTLKMGEYHVTYSGKKKEGIHLLYQVDYFSKEKNKYKKEFTLYPRVQLNEKMGNAAEPGTMHFLTHDVYTDITYAELSEDNSPKSEWASFDTSMVHLHDTIVTNNYLITLDSVAINLTEEEYKKQDSLLIISALFTAKSSEGNSKKLYSTYVIRNGLPQAGETTDAELGLKLILSDINPESGIFSVVTAEKSANKKDFIVMEAFIFPWINILWTGCVVMVIGILISVVNRVRFSLKSTHE